MTPTRGSIEYRAIAEELSGDLTLADLDPKAVERAREYAKRSHKRWPPKPVVSGWQFEVRSMRR